MSDPTTTETPAGERPTIERLKTWGPAAAVVLLILLSAPFLVGPSCPRKIVIASGSPEGAYCAFANRYREILAADGIELEVRTTAGSVENLELLDSAEDDVTLAIMQGGIATADADENIESLASLYLEPVWLFFRTDHPFGTPHPDKQTVQRLTDLAGKRIAVGAPGSGTRAIALQLLGENDLTGPESSATTFPLNAVEAAAALKVGEVDAAFFVISPQSPLVRDLLETRGIELMSFRRAEAYRRRHPYLSSVTLAEGTLDLDRNLPARDVVLLAPTANLVARKNLHGALVPLLMGAASRVHETGGLLEEPGTFPSARFVDFPLNADARRYLKSGPSMFYRFLPFSVAAWVDRMKLMLLPLLTLLLPFIKAAPPIYRWRIRSKIYRWYRVLREVDQKMKQADGNVDYSADIAQLTHLESELAEVSVPLSYMEEFYNLRLHVAFVRDRLKELDASAKNTIRQAA